MKLVVKPDMLSGKRGKSGLVALNLDFDQVKEFVKERLGVEVLHLQLSFPGGNPSYSWAR
jgi:succinyl-CoA synthetase beta subunit